MPRLCAGVTAATNFAPYISGRREALASGLFVGGIDEAIGTPTPLIAVTHSSVGTLWRSETMGMVVASFLLFSLLSPGLLFLRVVTTGVLGEVVTEDSSESKWP